MILSLYLKVDVKARIFFSMRGVSFISRFDGAGAVSFRFVDDRQRAAAGFRQFDPANCRRLYLVDDA